LPCGGCCGNRRGRRLPVRVYEFIEWVAGVRGVPMCQVLNEFPDCFVRALGVVGVLVLMSVALVVACSIRRVTC